MAGETVERASEAEVAATPDAVAGRALVEARVALCTPEEQAAFWEAVARCFGGGKPPAAEKSLVASKTA